MIYVTGRTDFTIEERTAITLGKFDGIHRGHQELLKRIKEKSPGLSTLVLTFDMSPAAFVKHEKESLITTNDERRHVVEAFGIDYLYEMSFTDQVMNLEAADFVRKVVKDLNVAYIAVGKDFRFGHKRAGDYKLLIDMAEECGYEIEIIDKLMYRAREISSTYVREMIANGDIETANSLLGYPFSVIGTVGYGRQLGRTIGIPTANVIPLDTKLLPPNGVYVSKVRIGDRTYGGVTNIGVKPTVGDKNEKGAETYIFDFNQNIYGQEITLELYYYVRPEKKFEFIDDLKYQMELDIQFAKNYLS